MSQDSKNTQNQHVVLFLTTFTCIRFNKFTHKKLESFLTSVLFEFCFAGSHSSATLGGVGSKATTRCVGTLACKRG